MAFFKGNSKKNVLVGTDLSDTILGLGNDDRLYGGAGNDTLYGGAGNDRLDGGAGIDTMRGGAGNDTYVLDNIRDKVIEGVGLGIDTARISFVSAGHAVKLAANVENIVLTGHADIGLGNALDNVITGNAFNNSLAGLDGSDTLYGGAGSDSLVGGNGDDTVYGGLGKDFLYGGSGNDQLSGGAGADTILGDEGTDIVSYQSSSAGVIVNVSTFNNPTRDSVGFAVGAGGDAQGDRLEGIEGLIGSNFNDDLAADGGNGPAVLIGGGGDDVLHGGASGDIILDGVVGDPSFGGSAPVPFFNVIGSGDDQLFGGAGDDFLSAGIGRDLINGGAGQDFLIGGAGADAFRYLKTTDTGVGLGFRDVIVDFQQGLDKIDLSAIDSSTDPAFALDPFVFGGQQPQGHIILGQFIPAPAPEISFYFTVGGNTAVQGYVSDNHGNAINRFEILLSAHLVLTAADFVL